MKTKIETLVDKLIDELDPRSEAFKTRLIKEINGELVQEAADKGSTAGLGDPASQGWVDKCIAKMKGKVGDPGAYCAAAKDKATGTTFWRGKGKKTIGPVGKEQEEPVEKAVPTKEKEGGAKDKWTVADFKDQVGEWKKAHGAKYDEKKLQAAIDKATGIAKKSTESAPGKATRAEVLGIMQRFFQKESLEEGKIPPKGTLYAKPSANNHWFGPKDIPKMKKVLKDAGMKNIHSANQFGWSNQPEVVLFTGDEKKAEVVIHKAWPNQFIIHDAHSHWRESEDLVDECAGAKKKVKKEEIKEGHEILFRSESGAPKMRGIVKAVKGPMITVEYSDVTRKVKMSNVVEVYIAEVKGPPFKDIKDAIKFYISKNPEYDSKSVEKAVKLAQKEKGSLDAVTVNHYIVEPRFGGKGHGKKGK